MAARGGLGPKRARVSDTEAITEATDVLRGKDMERKNHMRAVKGDQAWTSEEVMGRMSVTYRLLRHLR